MIIQNQFFCRDFAAVPVFYISVNLRISVKLCTLFFEMMIFFNKFIAVGKRQLASEFRIQNFAVSPYVKLYILVGRIFKSVIDIVVTNRCSGIERNALSLVRRKRVGMLVKFGYFQRTVQNE